MAASGAPGYGSDGWQLESLRTCHGNPCAARASPPSGCNSRRVTAQFLGCILVDPRNSLAQPRPASTRTVTQKGSSQATAAKSCRHLRTRRVVWQSRGQGFESRQLHGERNVRNPCYGRVFGVSGVRRITGWLTNFGGVPSCVPGRTSYVCHLWDRCGTRLEAVWPVETIYE
jgi:hypothetical protein